MFFFFALTDGTGVAGNGLASGRVGIAHDKDVIDSVIPRPEGVLEHPARSQDDLAVVSGGLVGRGSVEVPPGELVDGLGARGGERSRLRSALALGVDPDVFGEDLVGRVGKAVVAVDDGGVELGLSRLEVQVVHAAEVCRVHKFGGE